MKNLCSILSFIYFNCYFGLSILIEKRKNTFDYEYGDIDSKESCEDDIVLKNKTDSNVDGNDATGSARIIGGTRVTDIKLYPYHICYGDLCGGAIIDKRWAITAAHCGRFPFISVGSVGPYEGRKYLIKRHYLHPGWLARNKKHPFDYDFQLLEMFEDIKFSGEIQPVRIAQMKDLAIGKFLNITGWGVIKENGPLAQVLKVIKIPIVSKSKCQQLNVPLFRNQLTPRMFCAGYQRGGADACQGDSGGPAVENNKLYGLVSFGYRCALPNMFGVYANVVRVRIWIENTATFLV